MGLAARHPLSVAIVGAALAAVGAVFLFARPQYHPKGEDSLVNIPAKQPAADASGAAGWVWPDGVPGWEAGETFGDYNVSGVQPVELDAARLAAARNVLDAEGVRVVVSSRPNLRGVLAILAAPTLDTVTTPTTTCLGAVLEEPAPVRWLCPSASGEVSDLAQSRVLVAAAAYRPPPVGDSQATLYLVGVARGDVRRVVLSAPGLEPQPLYARKDTWGQFEAATDVPRGPVRLAIYGSNGLVETLPLELRPGEQRIFH